ncbi:MAG: hypothetical protein MUQ56_14760, partial [Thermoleophilia bacterium]|nr:hypothetical protein [Thermoleophilia bacterium]
MAQVLSDGTNAYFYCNRRVGEEQLAGWAYHLPDTLGSVRHLADPSGGLTLAHGLEPAGNTWLRVGYGFAGEWTDGKGLGASGLGRGDCRAVRRPGR